MILFENILRDEGFFHSIYSAHAAVMAVLGRFLVDGWACWGSARVLDPVRKRLDPDPSPSEAPTYMACSLLTSRAHSSGAVLLDIS